MAQWLGQFTGKTHLSKVRDREEQLRHAVGVYRAKTTPLDRDSQAKTVHRLAAQLLKARVRALKAKRNALGPKPLDSPLVQEMDAKINATTVGGISALLAEFKAADIE